MTKQAAIDDLTHLINGADWLMKGPAFSTDWKQWRSEVEAALRYIFPDNQEHLGNWNALNYSGGTPTNVPGPIFREGVESARAFLRARLNEVSKYWEEGHAPSESDQGQAVRTLLARVRQLHADAKRSTAESGGQFIQKNVAQIFNALLLDVREIIAITGFEELQPETRWRNLEAITGQLIAILEERESGCGQTHNAFELVTLLADRFHDVALQLRKRYAKRAPFEIEDEYDVQDLVHALLRLLFEDVRLEEWTPSHAGGAARMDFLIKEEQIVVETKMTRETLKARELGEQLIIDIEKYRQHPDCKTLVCFVYDRESLIHNPRGIERDLSRSEDDVTVRVLIRR